MSRNITRLLNLSVEYVIAGEKSPKVVVIFIVIKIITLCQHSVRNPGISVSATVFDIEK